MKRILLILLLFYVCISGCSKTTDVVAQVQAQAAVDQKVISTYLATNKITATRVDTSGVYYTIDTAGTGNALYTNSTTITMSYTGWVITNGQKGAQIASSTIAGETTFHPSFVLGSVILGWQLGIPFCKQGGTITLYLPSRYAYGPYPQPDIGLPANSVLIFNITIYSIVN